MIIIPVMSSVNVDVYKYACANLSVGICPSDWNLQYILSLARLGVLESSCRTYTYIKMHCGVFPCCLRVRFLRCPRHEKQFILDVLGNYKELSFWNCVSWDFYSQQYFILCTWVITLAFLALYLNYLSSIVFSFYLKMIISNKVCFSL